MAENTDENLTNEADAVDETAVQPTTPEVPAAPDASAVAAAPRLRDRMWSFRAMIAVAAATLLLGGAGGASLVAATNGGNDGPDRVGRFAGPGGGMDGQHRGPGGYGGPQFRQDGPQSGQQNGQQDYQQQGPQQPPAAPGSAS
ncbi:hypothetical protein EFK50_06600 [Nocardioides marmoriginsengisoli]|uniref:Uncharacterized protein n=1 Tax=Nocardioides marmoriginsengisoli TaxID=661483 RepID=A0A3N0CL75_9ACTN|nr:hypothetical protein [Nocardioides marmoriginsengisoli]RNL64198.1 hypothetical protein EFK50_06600 [Nocardioides marmoriginsengisoli]